VDDALTHFPELEPHLEVRAGLLSGGQQQMLALGRILAGSPQVILADEVSLGLAPRVVQRLLRALRAAADNGAAVLFVEQHPSLALRTVDRAYVLRRGRIVLEGTGADLRERRDEVAAFYL
jgi:branched-chain amino acid transport system ATP-binding protein